MLIFLFFIHVVATSHCYDLKLEGEINLDNDTLNIMKNILNIKDIGPNKKPFFRNDVNFPNQENDAKDTPVPKFTDELEIFAKNTRYSPVTEDPGHIKYKFVNKNLKKSFKSDLKAFKDQLSNGILKLNIIDILGINNSTTIQSLLGNAAKKYREHVDSYYDNISKTQPKNVLDREFVILDLIDTTNRLLHRTAKKLLLEVHDISPTLDNHVTKFENIILEEKKEAFKYACKKLQVCRYFLGFVDKMADLINEILILNDASFDRVIKDIIKAIEGKHWFVRKIMTVDTSNALESKLAHWKMDPEHMREILKIIQKVITQRYKQFTNDKPDLKVKTTAIRILLDLIDKVFHSDDEDFFTLELETTISSIKEWAKGESSSKINPLNIINRMVEMLNYHWGENTKEDVKVLTELIVLGTTRNEYVYEELFANGAYSRRYDESEIHSDSD